MRGGGGAGHRVEGSRSRRRGEARAGARRRAIVKEQAKKTLGRLRLLGAARAAYRGLYRAVRAARGVDRRLARRCFESANQPKLHPGCGNRLLDGWLNTDLHPRSAQAARLDATRRFPFADGVFALVYSEHLIEHVSFGEGAAMLRECFRVLSPGGRIRVATPDLRFLTALHRSDLSPLQERYRAWAVAEMPGMPEIGGGGGQIPAAASSSISSCAPGGIGSSTTNPCCAGPWRAPVSSG